MEEISKLQGKELAPEDEFVDKQNRSKMWWGGGFVEKSTWQPCTEAWLRLRAQVQPMLIVRICSSRTLEPR